MAATVDVRSLTVCDGDRRYRFTADCAGGTATLEAETGIHIRLLRWGEKCALARYAAAGPDFLAAQMLRLCADEPGAHMRDPALALVLWLHAPDEPPLPMDAPLLARVTLDLTRRLSSQLSEIAALPAPAVEQLWRVLEGAQPPADAALPDEVTQIIVLPDEMKAASGVVAVAPTGSSEAFVSAAEGSPASAQPAPPASRSAAAITPTRREPSAAENSSPPAQPIPLAYPSGSLTTPAHLETSARIEPSAPAEIVRELAKAPRFRVRLTPEAAPTQTRNPPALATEQEVDRATNVAWPMVGSLGPVGLPLGASSAAARPFAGVAPVRGSAAASSRTMSRREARMSSRPIPAGDTVPRDDLAVPRDDGAAAELPTAALSRVIAAVSRRQVASPMAMAPEEADMDELAERLEEAAATLGIAVVD